MELEGRVAVVTGGSKGIGRAICKKFVEEGARVAFCGRDSGRGREFEVELEGPAKFFPADVTHPDKVTSFLTAVLEEYGRVDILVNNAGIARDNLLVRMSSCDWDEVLRVNLTGAFHVTRVAARDMLRRRRGSIINISQ